MFTTALVTHVRPPSPSMLWQAFRNGGLAAVCYANTLYPGASNGVLACVSVEEEDGSIEDTFIMDTAFHFCTLVEVVRDWAWN